MKFKRILKSTEDGNRLVFGMSDSDLVLLANLVTGKIQIADMSGEEITSETQTQLHGILDEFTAAIKEDEKGDA